MKARLTLLARRVNAWLGARAGLRLVRTRRYHVVERNYYAPIPDEDVAGADLADRRSDLAGIELDLERQLRFVRDELEPFVREWNPPRHGDAAAGRFFLDNSAYQSVDAEILYALIRRFRPRRIVELGSGFSTLAAGEACVRNAADADAPYYAVFDPFPRGTIVPAGVAWLTRRETLRAQDVPLAEFDALAANDVLIVDTTHTVKLGGDVNRIVLDVLPRLAPGVFVHFHDVFLPWDYHPQLLADGRFYTEQYLLQAYLAENPHWEILFAAHALMREHRAELEKLVPSFMGSDHYPLAFWMRRAG